MGKILFMDESGKTGSMRFDENKMSWNYGNQPYFALCGLTVNDSVVEALQKFAEETRGKYKIQGELKASKSKVQQHAMEIITNLLELLRTYQCGLYIEIVDKKFCMAAMITDYCVLPYYDSPMCLEWVLCKRIFANELYSTVSDNLLCKLTKFFDENTQDIQELIHLCEQLKLECKNLPHLFLSINETIDTIQKYEQLGLKKHNLFPLVDYYKGGLSSIAIAPQINCLNNIITRVKNNNEHVSTIVHDKISDLSEAIIKTVEQRASAIHIKFDDSKKNDILQLTDVICGLVLSQTKNILDGDIEVEDAFRSIITKNVNFVSSVPKQERLFRPSKRQ